MYSATPLSCLACGHSWNYRGKALNDASKRVHCSKCNSTKITNSLGHKVNLGFKRQKLTSEVTSESQQPPNPEIVDPTISSVFSPTEIQPQPTQTLNLSEAKNILSQPLPTLQQIKSKTIQQPKVGVSGIQQQIIQQPTPTPSFTGNDFKILYTFLDDAVVWMTKHPEFRRTTQRHKEMGDLLASMFNKYGVGFAIEFVFVFAHLAYLSPILYFYRKDSKEKKEKEKKPDASTAEAVLSTVPEPQPNRTDAIKQTTKPLDYTKGKLKTIADYRKEK